MCLGKKHLFPTQQHRQRHQLDERWATYVYHHPDSIRIGLMFLWLAEMISNRSAQLRILTCDGKSFGIESSVAMSSIWWEPKPGGNHVESKHLSTLFQRDFYVARYGPDWPKAKELMPRVRNPWCLPLLHDKDKVIFGKTTTWHWFEWPTITWRQIHEKDGNATQNH